MTDTTSLERAFVETYESRSYSEQWEAVEDYERVQRVAANRAWVDDDGMPDCYRGLVTIQDRG